jgi:hypothetical protein
MYDIDPGKKKEKELVRPFPPILSNQFEMKEWEEMKG